MRRAWAFAFLMVMVASANAAIMTEGGRRVVLLGGKPFIPVSSGSILQTDAVSHILMVVGGGKILKVN